MHIVAAAHCRLRRPSRDAGQQCSTSSALCLETQSYLHSFDRLNQPTTHANVQAPGGAAGVPTLGQGSGRASADHACRRLPERPPCPATRRGVRGVAVGARRRHSPAGC